MDSRIADTFTESLASAAHPASPVIILEEPELGFVGSQIDLSGMGADVSQSTEVENGSVEVN